ncbi:hypothetical protein BSR03_23580 [Serratia proteamaculans]|uniref:hypothetical protein n=1 Tax=Serratia proteamaculans TaxID=28151 RepID=UPI000E0EDB32|nr:hypothetical protein [Serratia proteamaculans]RYM57785.1 hypothetical protein BSR03_23580 [Serratia proteamaculans]
MMIFQSLEILVILWIWLAGSLAVASVAWQTGRVWIGWLFYSILFTPVLAAILMCSVPHRPKRRLYGIDLLVDAAKKESTIKKE